MADNGNSQQTTGAARSIIRETRGLLRRQTVLSGLCLFLLAAVLLFWVTFGLESFWFAVQKLELPSGIRRIALIGMLLAGGWLLLRGILIPAVRRMSELDIAVLLEGRVREFRDSLVTTVRPPDTTGDEQPLAAPMLERTIEDADRVASEVQPAALFRGRRLQRLSRLAAAGVVTIAGAAIARPDTMTRWWSAFVECRDTYRIRTTDVEYSVIAQPGSRSILLEPADGQFQHLHSRGTDFELVMKIPEGENSAGRPWVVPQRIRVDLDRADGTSSRTYVSAATDRTFRFVLSRLRDDVTINVLAGDYRNPLPLKVRSVAPPVIESIELDSRYPEYTGLNAARQAVSRLTGRDIILPVGTEFQLTGSCTKPLQSIEIVSDHFEITSTRTGTSMLVRARPTDFDDTNAANADTLISDGRSYASAISDDGLRFSLQGLISATGSGSSSDETDSEETPSETESRNPTDAALSTDGDGNGDGDSPRLVLATGTVLRLILHDEEDIRSPVPEELRVQAVDDNPPVVATRLSGVENAVTRQAVIPFTGSLSDDYGLSSVRYEFAVDDQTEWRPRPLRTSLPSGARVLELDDSSDGTSESAEYFDVRPLELSEGQILSLTVAAEDGCRLPAPQISRGEPILFRIVSNEELLSLLYTREIALRQRLEEVVAALEEVREDLEFHDSAVRRLQQGDAPDTAYEDRQAVITCTARAGDGVRRSTNEVTAIAGDFDLIIRQLINNAVPPTSLSESMRLTISDPLRAVASQELEQAARRVEDCRRAAEEGTAESALLKAAGEAVTDAVSRIRTVLENVRDMAEMHEILSDLKGIRDEQLRIREATRQLQKKKAFGDLFD